MKKANIENIKEIKATNLPDHLKGMLIDRIKKADKFGFDPEWQVKAKEKADDFSIIHAII